MREEKEQFDKKNEMFFVTCTIKNERDQMINEELVSRHVQMSEDLDSAVKWKSDNIEKIINYGNI